MEVNNFYFFFQLKVKIKVRTQCSPLTEDEFRPIIAENYYEQRLFWFELDRAQTHRLISLFTSRGSVSRPLNMATHKAAFPTSYGPQRSGDAGGKVSCTFLAPLDNTNMGWGGSWGALGSGESEKNGLHPKPSSGSSYSAIVSGTSTSVPKKSIPFTEKKWSSLFESSTTNVTGKKDENSEPKISEVNLRESGVEWASSSDVPYQSGQNKSFEALNSEWADGRYHAENQSFQVHCTNWASGNYDAENQSFEAQHADWGSGNYGAENQSFEVHDTNAEWRIPAFGTYCETSTGYEEGHGNHLPFLDDDTESEHPSGEKLPVCHTSCEAPIGSDKVQDADLPCSDGCHADGDGSTASETTADLDEDGQDEPFADNCEACDEPLRTEAYSEQFYSSAVVEMDSSGNHGEESADPSSIAVQTRFGNTGGNTCSSEVVAIADTTPPDVQAVVVKVTRFYFWLEF